MRHSARQDPASVQEVVDRLRHKLQRWEEERRATATQRWRATGLQGCHLQTDCDVLPTGVPQLDAVLPWGGVRRGSLVEFLGAQGSGVGTLALVVARQAILHTGGVLVIVERRRRFYPPAAASWQIPLDRCLWIEAPDVRLQAWAVDQSLRCPVVAAVWVLVERLEEKWYRRWQLAAESAGTLGLLVCSITSQSQSSWADVRLGITPYALIASAKGSVVTSATPSSSPGQGNPRRRLVRVDLLRCRHGPAGASLKLWLDDQSGQIGFYQRESDADEAGGVSVAATLVHPAALRLASGVEGKAAGAVRS